ncbi:FAD-binding oxidoreductase [Actinoallomurus soli]|uniref:FAD-binding oxidoreductase n=1 Tax=Actinoallomurus soli TaxID=2952535 RepID=UPI00209294A0|nr:FAD-binding oxidoreductase [Actinoallomurus soli]MCO5968540.1 FAD-binding oxidoreductase [Actinoallomurus soli]
MSETTRDGLDRLRARTRGPVHLPGTDGYDGERLGFQRLDPHRPAVIVGAAAAEDVRAAVEYAAAHGLRVAVQATGHGLGRALRDGVLITTRRMSEVRVDPESRTAWVGAGTAWRDVVEAAAPYGLAPLSGSFPGVGAVSYTLGGGIGLVARRHGFAADHVRRIDLVTADGRLRTVTAASEPDLFWALRGGGRGFGVVTGMEIGLLPITRMFGGGLYFDVAETPDAPETWRRWTATVPEELTSGMTVLSYPDLPMVPEELRGRHVAHVQVAHLGGEAEGRELVEPLRALGPRLRDSLRELPYTEGGTIFAEPDRPHAYRSRNHLLRALDPGALAALIASAGPAAPVMCVIGLRHLGGALARLPEIPNAVGHREAAYLLNVLSPVEPGEEDKVRALHEELLAPFAADALGRSLNFGYGPPEEDESAAAFGPETHRRLAGLRAACDPDGVFDV